MYLDAMEFLDEEREAWRPYEALLELTGGARDPEKPAGGEVAADPARVAET